MVTELIADHLTSLNNIILQVVRQKANALADNLANHAMDHPREIIDTCWQDITNDDLRNQCALISRQDLTGGSSEEDDL